MAMRIVDRLAGGKQSSGQSELSEVVGYFHKLVLDRVDHKALASLSLGNHRAPKQEIDA